MIPHAIARITIAMVEAASCLRSNVLTPPQKNQSGGSVKSSTPCLLQVWMGCTPGGNLRCLCCFCFLSLFFFNLGENCRVFLFPLLTSSSFGLLALFLSTDNSRYLIKSNYCLASTNLLNQSTDAGKSLTVPTKIDR